MTADVTELVPVERLEVGDWVDLFADPYADPEGDHPALEDEYAVVGDLFGFGPGELETSNCYRLDFEGGACGFPPGHLIARVLVNEHSKLC
jgi:hypothetical protein